VIENFGAREISSIARDSHQMTNEGVIRFVLIVQRIPFTRYEFEEELTMNVFSLLHACQ
jgi:hypothetical protein